MIRALTLAVVAASIPIWILAAHEARRRGFAEGEIAGICLVWARVDGPDIPATDRASVKRICAKAHRP